MVENIASIAGRVGKLSELVEQMNRLQSHLKAYSKQHDQLCEMEVDRISLQFMMVNTNGVTPTVEVTLVANNEHGTVSLITSEVTDVLADRMQELLQQIESRAKQIAD